MKKTLVVNRTQDLQIGARTWCLKAFRFESQTKRAICDLRHKHKMDAINFFQNV